MGASAAGLVVGASDCMLASAAGLLRVLASAAGLRVLASDNGGGCGSERPAHAVGRAIARVGGSDAPGSTLAAVAAGFFTTTTSASSSSSSAAAAR